VLRVTELLGQSPTGLPLEHCLPPIPRAAPDRSLRLRAALASTLVAGLELARDGRAMLRQDEAFKAVLIGPVPA